MQYIRKLSGFFKVRAVSLGIYCLFHTCVHKAPQTGSNQITSFTLFRFAGKKKCDRYWPYDNEPINVADLVLQMISESSLAAWTIREFTLSKVCCLDL